MIDEQDRLNYFCQLESVDVFLHLTFDIILSVLFYKVCRGWSHIWESCKNVDDKPQGNFLISNVLRYT